MFRRSVDYGILNQNSQVLDFNYFRRKNQPSLDFQPGTQTGNTYSIKDSHNMIPIIMVLTAMVRDQPLPKQKNNRSIFQNLTLRNVPKLFSNYQHPSTLSDIFRVVSSFFKVQGGIQEIINNYPITQFILNCLSRAITLAHLNEHRTKLQLMGNEDTIIEDYELEIRGTLLHILSNALNLSTHITFIGPTQQKSEYYGQNQNSIKLMIRNDGERCHWQIETNESFVTLTTTYSSQNMVTNIKQVKRPKENENDTTDEGHSFQRIYESKSATKDSIRCTICSLKSCTCKKGKGITPRQLNYQGNKSFFDGLNFGYINAGNQLKKERIRENNCERCKREKCSCRK